MGFIINIINKAFFLYELIIVVRIVLSYIRHDSYHPLIRFVYEVTEPVLGFFRRIIPPMGMIDISPVIAIFALEFVHWLVIGIL